MTTRALRWGLLTVLMMRPLPCQDQPEARSIRAIPVEIGQPVKHLVLCDMDGDGMNDAVLVTKTVPSFCFVAKRVGRRPEPAPPVAFEIAKDCEGLILQPLAKGAALLQLTAAGIVKVALADFAAAPPKAPLPEGRPPEFLGFAQDFDGDGVGDPLVPGDEGFDLVLSKTGRSVALRPPVTRARAAAMRGLVSERSRFPLLSLEALARGAVPRPCFFANDRLFALQGSFESGFGPSADTVLKVPSTQQEATLERTEARLVDIEGNGDRQLLVVRTRTKVAALAQIKTELIFHRLGGPNAGRPVQAILLPGILSSGPEIRDVDRDGRLDLFLSVFGEDLSQQVARRITGKVKLEYLLYRGIAGEQPFSRSPDFTESDSVPEAQFSEWGLRHRLMLDADWTADGAPDLVSMSTSPAGTKIEVRAGAVQDGKAHFREKPSLSAESGIPVLDYRPWGWSATEPAIICRTASGALIFSTSR